MGVRGLVGATGVRVGRGGGGAIVLAMVMEVGIRHLWSIGLLALHRLDVKAFHKSKDKRLHMQIDALENEEVNHLKSSVNGFLRLLA